MIKSMTAYGRGEIKKEGILFIAEIRSLNNRYRDIILRIPKNYQALENELKSVITSRIRRGRIEVTIQIEKDAEESLDDLELNWPLVNTYFKFFNQMNKRFGLNQEIKIDSLLQLKDAILLRPKEADVEKVTSGLEDVLRLSLDSLDVMRMKEGEAIQADIIERLTLVEGLLNQVDYRAPILIEEYREKLTNKISHMLLDVQLEESRFTQEVAFFAERSDITEEIVRIRSHLEQFREYLSRDDTLGRRLDFLIQEINREVNTLSAKASDSFISKLVVEMKAELEKLREQVQNVE